MGKLSIVEYPANETFLPRRTVANRANDAGAEVLLRAGLSPWQPPTSVIRESFSWPDQLAVLARILVLHARDIGICDSRLRRLIGRKYERHISKLSFARERGSQSGPPSHRPIDAPKTAPRSNPTMPRSPRSPCHARWCDLICGPTIPDGSPGGSHV